MQLLAAGWGPAVWLAAGAALLVRLGPGAWAQLGPQPLADAAALDIQFSDQPDLLLAAAGHHYGPHFGSLKKHHKSGGYQYVEVHKPGAFDSGFKRTSKKMKISGRSSQHGSHADGHVKWRDHKSSGSHTWSFKHKDKKAKKHKMNHHELLKYYY